MASNPRHAACTRVARHLPAGVVPLGTQRRAAELRGVRRPGPKQLVEDWIRKWHGTCLGIVCILFGAGCSTFDISPKVSPICSSSLVRDLTINVRSSEKWAEFAATSRESLCLIQQGAVSYEKVAGRSRVIGESPAFRSRYENVSAFRGGNQAAIPTECRENGIWGFGIFAIAEKTGNGVCTPRAASPDMQRHEIIVFSNSETSRTIRLDLRKTVLDVASNPRTGEFLVLLGSERFGLAPWEILAALSGHPIPHNRVTAVWLESDGSISPEVEIVGDATYGRARVAN